MPKQTVHMGRSEESLFELISRGRKGPGDTLVLTPGQVAAVERTVGRTPEVMVKVSGGSREAKGVKAHFFYFDHNATLEIYTDEARKAVRMTWHNLRQQQVRPEGKPNYCLSDFVAPKASGVADYIGAFAVTAGALACTKPGAQPSLPHRRDVEQLASGGQ